MIIFKRIYTAQFWCVWNHRMGVDKKLAFNSTDGDDADGAFMNGTVPNATNIFVGGTSVNTNANDGHYMCYAWTSIQGFSKFGSYTGNGNANGPFIYTGFKPAWIMTKQINGGSSWIVHDNKRDPINTVTEFI